MPECPQEEEQERPTIPVPDADLDGPAAELVRTLQERDHEKFDTLIESSIAAGGDLTGVHCLRVVSYVTRQHVPAAKKALEAAKQSPNQTQGAAIRISIASACLQLARGRERDAMIDALEALAAARSQEDGPGEVAALKMVSAACLAAGMESDANRLSHVAEAVAS